VVLCQFSADPWPLGQADLQAHTLEVVGTLVAHGVPTILLSKNPPVLAGTMEAARDLLQVWTTILFSVLEGNQQDFWEPGAATVAAREHAMLRNQELGFRVCVSVEPVLDPSAALKVIRWCRSHGIEVRVGLASGVGSWPEEARKAYMEAWFDWRGEVPQWAYRAFARELADRYGGDPGVILKKSIRDRLPATPGEREG
jgi:DNA repair photolyase